MAKKFMKGVSLSFIISVLAFITALVAIYYASTPKEVKEGLAKRGNGAPNGQHYNLNIIGVPKNKVADMTGNNGGRIFVNLEGNTKINLTEGDTFRVLDANGTDGNGATFQLPNPDPDNDGITEYSVYARALGKPGGSAKLTACGTDPVTQEFVCSSETLTVGRTKGKSTFQNVSKQLLYLYVYDDLDLNGDGVVDVYAGRYPLFDSTLEGYFWDYDQGNPGLKLLQLRFYEIPTTVE